jgi:uncharacterized pyridoxamine 5'-phosphate oxidase family protein
MFDVLLTGLVHILRFGSLLTQQLLSYPKVLTLKYRLTCLLLCSSLNGKLSIRKGGKKVIDFLAVLEKNPDGVFATRDGENVKTRVFQYLFADGNKIYFCTNSKKAVYSQMMANPNVSFCTFPQDYSPVLSVNGKAVFVDDAALKARVLDENPSIKDMYKSPDNPIFKIFYIDAAEIHTFNYKNGSKTYSLQGNAD